MDLKRSLAQQVAALEEEFRSLEPRERLELLLDYASRLPPLPEEFQELRDREDMRVHECQTPVFLWITCQDGRVRMWAEVAEEAPTVKGFVALVRELVEGASAEEVRQLNTNLVTRLGLVEALGMVRMRGLSAIVHRVRRACSDNKGL